MVARGNHIHTRLNSRVKFASPASLDVRPNYCSTEDLTPRPQSNRQRFSGLHSSPRHGKLNIDDVKRVAWVML